MFREMRRKKQQLSFEECQEILNNEVRGVLSVIGDNGYPYGIPINYKYSTTENKIYFHGAKKGHKIKQFSATSAPLNRGSRVATLSNTPLKRLAHVPYREPFSDKLMQ